ncbi:heat-inducible transcription repressor HrcA [bacterium]|nr:heat-inducible transcription repressor HrcA [bacterium]
MNETVNIEISQRGKQILRIIIEEHMRTGRPVGSRFVSKKLGGAISPATVRNVMQDLEEVGLLWQPHTSAGRVPTALALRYYLANMMKPKKLTFAEKKEIEQVFLNDFTDILQLMENVGRVLAALSNEISVIVSPGGEDMILHKIELIPISSKNVVLVLVTRTGMTRSIVMECNGIEPRKLEEFGQRLNERLAGLTFSEIKKTIRERIADLQRIYSSFSSKLVQSAREIFSVEDEVTAVFGRENIVKKPEFSDQRQLSQLMSICESDELLIKCIPSDVPPGQVEIVIDSPPIEQLAMVVSSYSFGYGRGFLGVVGSKRMNYPKLVELVSYTANRISHLLSGEEIEKRG